MTKKRNRARQTTSLQERLASFARSIRVQAATTPDGPEKDALIRRAITAEDAARFDKMVSH